MSRWKNDEKRTPKIGGGTDTIELKMRDQLEKEHLPMLSIQVLLFYCNVWLVMEETIASRKLECLIVKMLVCRARCLMLARLMMDAVPDETVRSQ